MVVMERPAPGSHPPPGWGGSWDFGSSEQPWTAAHRAQPEHHGRCAQHSRGGKEGGRGGLEGVSGWGWVAPGWLWAPPVSGAVRFPAATVTPAPKSQRLRTLHPPGKGQGWLGRPCPREGGTHSTPGSTHVKPPQGEALQGVLGCSLDPQCPSAQTPMMASPRPQPAPSTVPHGHTGAGGAQDPSELVEQRERGGRGIGGG